MESLPDRGHQDFELSFLICVVVFEFPCHDHFVVQVCVVAFGFFFGFGCVGFVGGVGYFEPASDFDFLLGREEGRGGETREGRGGRA